MDEHFSYIMSVPGVGYVTAGIILGEIGDISRFRKPNKVLAYAGLDPLCTNPVIMTLLEEKFQSEDPPL